MEVLTRIPRALARDPLEAELESAATQFSQAPVDRRPLEDVLDNGDLPDYDHPTYIFGDPMTVKDTDIIRAIGVNICGYPLHNSSSNHKSKNKLIRDLLRHAEADLLCTQEDNAYWPNFLTTQLPKERFRGWTRSLKVSSAYNQDSREADGPHLQGGCSIYAVDSLVHRRPSTNHDPSLLGRWLSMQFTGHNNTRLRVFSAYCPCISSGDQTVYAQQLQCLLGKKDDRCPRQAFWEDLAADIQQYQLNGDQILLSGDFNTDITSSAFLSWCSDLGLHNAIHSHHGPQGPPTHSRGPPKLTLSLFPIPYRL